MERALVVINPKSRHGDLDLGPALTQLRAAGWELLLESPTRERVSELIASHCPHVAQIIVAGGDGTLNAAAAALTDCGHPVGLLPMGTANDLARTLGIPKDIRKAGEIILQGRRHAIDLGCVNGVLFFNAAHIGIGTELTRRISSARKRRLGPLAYPRTLFSAYRRSHPFIARIACDNEHLRLSSLQITVGNGHYYGGGAPVAPRARIDDGELFLYSIPPQKTWQLATLLPRLRRGTHEGHPRVLLLHGRSIVVEPMDPMPVTADGEIRTLTPAHFSVLPGALEFFVPGDYPGGPSDATQ